MVTLRTYDSHSYRFPLRAKEYQIRGNRVKSYMLEIYCSYKRGDYSPLRNQWGAMVILSARLAFRFPVRNSSGDLASWIRPKYGPKTRLI